MSALAVATVEELAELAEGQAAAYMDTEESEVKLLAFALWQRASADLPADQWISGAEALLYRAGRV